MAFEDEQMFGNNRKDFLRVRFIITNIFLVLQNRCSFREEKHGISIFVSWACMSLATLVTSVQLTDRLRGENNCLEQKR